MSKYSELDVINGAVDDIMGGRPIEDAIGEIGSAVDAALAKHREKDEQLRELLSYCKTEAEKFDPDDQHDEFNPYDDLVYRLSEILDGER
jgi:hypothetical protein